jgi:hypothetical protein
MFSPMDKVFREVGPAFACMEAVGRILKILCDGVRRAETKR